MRYAEVPESMTAPTPLPAPPQPRCADIDGWPALCEWQVVQHVIELEAALRACNEDKGSIADLTRPDGG